MSTSSHPPHVPEEIVFAVSESDEGGFEARALGYDIFTEADTVAALHDMIRDAVRCHFAIRAIREPGSSTSTA